MRSRVFAATCYCCCVRRSRDGPERCDEAGALAVAGGGLEAPAQHGRGRRHNVAAQILRRCADNEPVVIRSAQARPARLCEVVGPAFVGRPRAPDPAFATSKTQWRHNSDHHAPQGVRRAPGIAPVPRYAVHKVAQDTMSAAHFAACAFARTRRARAPNLST